MADAPLRVLDTFKYQLLVVLLKRLGGATVPASEVDAAAEDVVTFSVKGEEFHFEVLKKEAL